MFGLNTTIASIVVRKDGSEEENITANGVRIPLFRKSSSYTWSGAANLDNNFHKIEAVPYLFLEPVSDLVSQGTVVINFSITILRHKYKNTHVGQAVLTLTDNLPTQYALEEVIPEQLQCGDVVIITASRDGSHVSDTVTEDLKGLGLFIASK